MNYLRRLPPPKLLLAFEAAARTLNFTKAAEELNVHQPAISRQIRALEEFLGVDLFVRNGPSVSLTVAGERYRDEVVAAFQRLALVRLAAMARRARLGGEGRRQTPL